MSARNLTGVWNGLYTYASGISVSFVATLIDGGSALFGSTHEPDVLGVNPGRMLYAQLSGGRQDNTIGFVKSYDGAGDAYYHLVDYEGVLNADATEIEGRWHIGNQMSGRFLMIRSDGKAVAVEQKKFVRA